MEQLKRKKVELVDDTILPLLFRWQLRTMCPARSISLRAEPMLPMPYLQIFASPLVV